MKGLFLKDVQLLQKMDKNLNNSKESLIDISNRNLNKKALEKQEFLMLTQDIKNILKDLGKQLTDGVVSIAPDKKANHCKYCKFMGICRKNSMM